MDLTVVVADGPEVDRVITDHLVRPTSRICWSARWATPSGSGPLVLPGRTSCLRCADLTRRDADPQWPMVLAQLSRLRLDLPEVLTGWAASVAAAQALAFLGGEQPETAGATLELTARRSASPSCGPGPRTPDAAAVGRPEQNGVRERRATARRPGRPRARDRSPARPSGAAPGWPHCRSASPAGPRWASASGWAARRPSRSASRCSSGRPSSCSGYWASSRAAR